MPKEECKEVNPFLAYIVVAIASAIASIAIVLVAITNLRVITDSGIWAIAVMTLSPALMAFGVSYFISVSSRSVPSAQNTEPGNRLS